MNNLTKQFNLLQTKTTNSCTNNKTSNLQKNFEYFKDQIEKHNNCYNIKSTKHVVPTTSLENLYIPRNNHEKCKIYSSSVLESSRRHSKSEMHLNMLSDEIIRQQQHDQKEAETSEFLEKTEDLLAKALKIALENRQEIFKKTDLDKDRDEYIKEDNKNLISSASSNPTIENCCIQEENNTMMMSSPPPGVVTDSDGLIVPKKLINPCLESNDRRDLHRELRFNQKVGKSVLNQKTELQKAMEKQKERQILAQQQQQQHQQQPLLLSQHHLNDNNETGLKNELNRVIMERQQKIDKKNLSIQQDQEQLDSHVNPEYLNARAKLRTRIDTK